MIFLVSLVFFNEHPILLQFLVIFVQFVVAYSLFVNKIVDLLDVYLVLLQTYF
jgi:hypothetical protein